MRGNGAAGVASPDWSAIREAIRAGDVPSFLAELRRELLDGWLTIGTLHGQLQSCCFAKVAPINPGSHSPTCHTFPGWCLCRVVDATASTQAKPLMRHAGACRRRAALHRGLSRGAAR